MKQFSAKDAAVELGTDGKTLRRFLRQDATYRNAGAGGRYTFTTADMPTLRARFNAWAKPRTTRVAKAKVANGDAGLSHVEAKNPALVKKLTEERIDRLEAALREKGLHISQMRERETWASVSA